MAAKKQLLKGSSKVQSLVKILFLIFVVLTLISLYYHNKVKINIMVQTPVLNEMMTVNVEVKKGNQYLNLDSLNIELQHKYKKDEKISTELTPYSAGRYQLYYYPQIQGDYLIDIVAQKDDNKYYKNSIIKVE
ncbi:MAG: hypothetical protein ACK5HR_06275 [Mycoplasmatales bacterium]